MAAPRCGRNPLLSGRCALLGSFQSMPVVRSTGSLFATPRPVMALIMPLLFHRSLRRNFAVQAKEGGGFGGEKGAQHYTPCMLAQCSAACTPRHDSISMHVFS